MHDLIGQYRVDLEAQLVQDTSVFEARILSDEIEHHLRERVAALIELGASPEAAQVEALSAMGPTSQLARAYQRKALRRWTLGPASGNWLLFAVAASIIVFKDAFLRVDLVNAMLVLAWLCSPAFCRRYPIWGVLGGIAALELFLVMMPGRAQFPSDLIGMATVVLFTLISFVGGLFARAVLRRLRLRFTNQS